MHYGGRLENCLGKVYACRHEIAARFYELLFEAYPDARNLFRNDHHKQLEMFSMMVAMIARYAATGQEPADMAKHVRAHHKGLAIGRSTFLRGGVLLRQAYLDVLGDRIDDFEATLLTDVIGKLTMIIAEDASE